jgi:hypothetical protein
LTVALVGVVGTALGALAGVLAAPSLKAADKPAAGSSEGGFACVRLLMGLCCAIVLLVSFGCAGTTIQQTLNCGEFQRDKSDVKQSTTEKTALDGNTAQVSPNVSLVPK